MTGLCATVLLMGSVQAAQITMKGSDTMVILAQKWAEVYMQKKLRHESPGYRRRFRHWLRCLAESANGPR